MCGREKNIFMHFILEWVTYVWILMLRKHFYSMTNQLVPAECAVKVFKTTLVDFKNRIQYVKGDVRFFKDDFKKHNPRRIIKIWAEKEDHNLRR